jgi:hypothetical protein
MRVEFSDRYGVCLVPVLSDIYEKDEYGNSIPLEEYQIWSYGKCVKVFFAHGHDDGEKLFKALREQARFNENNALFVFSCIVQFREDVVHRQLQFTDPRDLFFSPANQDKPTYCYMNAFWQLL